MSSTTTSTAKPGFITTVLYRQSPTLTFNLDYYLTHHIPMVDKYWTPHGLLDTQVAKVTGESEFAYAITMTWNDEASWNSAKGTVDEMREIMGDVQKFTNAEALFVLGRVIG
jgi:hypothetical protein